VVTICDAVNDGKETPITLSLNYISNSIYYSIRWLVEHQSIPPEGVLNLELALLNNLCLFVNTFELPLADYKDILVTIIMPIIQREVNTAITVFEGNNSELMKALNDCCDAQSQATRLSITCKLLDVLASVKKSIYYYLRGYLLSILASYTTYRIPQDSLTSLEFSLANLE
jgi:hypothetical protein